MVQLELKTFIFYGGTLRTVRESYVGVGFHIFVLLFYVRSEDQLFALDNRFLALKLAVPTSELNSVKQN